MTTATSPFATTIVFTEPGIADGTAAVRFAYRQPGTGLWYLLAEPGPGEAVAETMVAMDALLARDPSLAQLAAMPPGRGAQRESPGSSWSVFSIAARGAERAAEATAEAEVEAETGERVAALARRRIDLANTTGACVALAGIVALVIGGFMVLTVKQPAPLYGFAANLALGVPVIAVGLWLLICGIAGGASPRARPILLAALPIIALAVLPLLRPSEAGPLIEVLTAAWPDLLADGWRSAVRQRWHGVSIDQGLFALVALALLWRAVAVAFLGRRLAKEQARAA
ncbi:MAG TPA: hypothetical protein VEL07_12620 [Planctomycetota bacterium]|nr:hypothetical protein [Planctomycetota bacterium]